MAGFLVFLLSSIAVLSCSQAVLTVKEPSCLEGAVHKKEPTAEGADYAACHMFKDLSCCTAEFTKQLNVSQIMKIGNFSWITCGPLSTSCEAYMKEIECFYQCSPYVGYWKGTFKGSFANAPLCSNVCDDWFNACQSDMTCANNWITDFDTDEYGRNSCKNNTTCRNFTEVYGNGRGLCEGMWGQSFKYHVSKEEHDCLTLNFSMPITNINYEVVLKTFGTNNAEACYHVTTALVVLSAILSVVAAL